MHSLSPRIVYEDDAILAVDKPSGLTVNRSETTLHEKTLQDWVQEKGKVPNVSKGADFDTFSSRAGIVHRLDKETSGILLIAKTPEAFIKLQAQFTARAVRKMYTALVHGIVTPETGEIRLPTGRLPWNRMRFGVLPGGKDAVTRYEVDSYYQRGDIKNAKPTDPKYGYATLVRVFPETGRTHQIRVHFQHIGHPLIADALYAGRKQAKTDRALLQRVFLHASELSFVHPITHTPIHLSSPLPVSLKTFLDTTYTSYHR